ncbi:MAG: hypothetical protein FD130_1857, partial [Halothiobacillaceae bacterium]
KDLDRIKISLANDETYLAAGVERADLLNKLVFTVESRAGGVVVLVSSKESMREPFLDFIIEVNWPGGRLLREYTLLLDPPVYTTQKAAPIDAPTASSPPAEGIATAQSTAKITSSAGGATATGDATPRNPVESGTAETLSHVATKLRAGADDFTIEQVMMGVFKGNPEAFIDSNINNLKAGYVLHAPDKATLDTLSRKEAAQLASEHYQKWLAMRRKGAVTSVSSSTREAAPATFADSASTPPGGRSTLAADAQLRLVSPAEGSNSATQGGAGDKGLSGDDLALVMAKAKEGQQDTESLKARVTALEKQLANMERLISLKSEALTQLQQQLGNGGSQGVTLPATVTPPVDNSAVAHPANEAVATTAPEVTPPNVESTTTPEPAAAVKPPIAESKKQVVEPEPSPEVSWLEMVTDPQVLLVGVGLLLAAGAGVWRYLRRRKENDSQEYDGLIFDFDTPGGAATTNSGSEPAFGSMTTQTAERGKADPVYSEEDYTSGGFETLQADEADIDPLAEADVYLAYRRFQQAEELIKEALSRSPDRDDLQLKLLEIYFGAG